MNVDEIIRGELKQAAEVLEHFTGNLDNISKIEEAAQLISKSFKDGGKAISCGNGGSHCDAMHFAEELSGKFREDRKPLPAICISDPSYITCVANDFGFEQVFSRAVDGLGKPGDVLLALSTSGNSQNVINAVLSAKQIGMKSIILCGSKGGRLSGMGDVEICVDHKGYADRIQEVHIKIIHIIILLVENQV